MLHQVQRRITSTITPATVVYLQIDNGNIANQIHGFTIDYGKFIVNIYISLLNKDDARSTYISWKFSHSKCSFASESFSSTITVKWCLECFYVCRVVSTVRYKINVSSCLEEVWKSPGWNRAQTNKTHVHVEAALKDIKKLHPLLLNISVEK